MRRVISEKEQPPAGYSLLSRTADTDQKAGRHRRHSVLEDPAGTVRIRVGRVRYFGKVMSECGI